MPSNTVLDITRVVPRIWNCSWSGGHADQWIWYRGGANMKSARSSSFASDRPTDTKNPLPELRSFLQHLATERGLANNSIHAYRRDLEDADKYLNSRSKTLLTATADNYHQYLQNQSRKGQSTKTVARRIAAI